jgi:hypothetical protein
VNSSCIDLACAEALGNVSALGLQERALAEEVDVPDPPDAMESTDDVLTASSSSASSNVCLESRDDSTESSE